MSHDTDLRVSLGRSKEVPNVKPVAQLLDDSVNAGMVLSPWNHSACVQHLLFTLGASQLRKEA